MWDAMVITLMADIIVLATTCAKYSQIALESIKNAYVIEIDPLIIYFQKHASKGRTYIISHTQKQVN